MSPRLKKLLAVIFALVALLGANSVYLVAITVLGTQYQNAFYILMFALHLALGLGLVLPFVVFAGGHLISAIGRPNRKAVTAGIALLVTSLLLIASGVVLVRFEGFQVRDAATRSLAYWVHVITPLVAIALYVAHRIAGPIIKWRWAGAWAGAVGAFVLAMGFLHHQDPRLWGVRGPKEGAKYFAPSSALTATGNFIPDRVLMLDSYCMKCHPDAAEQHAKSVHHFSSFNNKPYLFSVAETRQVSLKRDGTVQASRWCAGCHDPVPFFSGRFDDPNYNIKDKTDASTQAGITCVVCHGITNINGVTGNAAFTIDEPVLYPFTFSDNAFLQWLNNQLVKAKPALHKRAFLKEEIHRSSEFCSTCHKVSLPFALNHYKDWLRGQDHYNPFLLSGVSGHGVQSFYYPDKAKERCASCHMPTVGSNDFGARDFDKAGKRSIHNHLFLGANTGLPFLRNFERLRAAGVDDSARLSREDRAAYDKDQSIIDADQAFLKDGQLRLDIFALREGGTIEGELFAPLRPELPALKPGAQYLVEVVIRTLKMGHLFTQGTIDSNEVWVDFEAKSGECVIGRSGAMDGVGTVDPWSHFVNALVIDRHGNRIDRRNPQDIYVPVYNHQIPPGAAQVVHYLLKVPDDATEPVRLTAKLNYRKFDRKYMELVHRDDGGPGANLPVPNLPVTELCADAVTLPVAGGDAKPDEQVSKIPEWQRWNDYGIGLFLEGDQSSGSEKGELRQAEQVFKRVVELGEGVGYANLARIYLREKRLPDAVAALQAAAESPDMFPPATAGSGPGQPPASARAYTKPAPRWVVAWLTGLVNEQNGQLDEAIAAFELILSDEMQRGVADRGFDFTRDFRVWNELGIVRAERAGQERSPKRVVERERWLRAAIDALRHTLAIDPEDLTAHFKLAEVYGALAGKLDPHRATGADGAILPSGPDPGTLGRSPAEAKLIAVHELRRLATELINRLTIDDGGVEAAQRLQWKIPAYLAADRDPFESRLSVLVELLGTCQRAFFLTNFEPLTESDRAVAGVLNVLHRELHQIYKLDDNAREAIAKHRAANPAANHAAQSIVIYSLSGPPAAGAADASRMIAPVPPSGGE